MSCGVVCRCGLDLAVRWLQLAAVAPIRPLAWEPPYAEGAALKRKKKKKWTLFKTKSSVTGFLHVTFFEVFIRDIACICSLFLFTDE